jgi:transposase
LLRQILAHKDVLEAAIGQLAGELDQRRPPYEQAVQLVQAVQAVQLVQLVQTIPGVKAVAAATLVAALGVDMTPFPSAKHLASWAAVCPGNNQRGGKRLSGRTRRGNAWLKAVLCEVAWANARRQTSSSGAQFRPLGRSFAASPVAVASPRR